jgi:hypothetical protein
VDARRAVRSIQLPFLPYILHLVVQETVADGTVGPFDAHDAKRADRHQVAVLIDKLRMVLAALIHERNRTLTQPHAEVVLDVILREGLAPPAQVRPDSSGWAEVKPVL